ncbi:MAG: hypothetical protein WD048_15355 [Chitinophagales bacterium]
MNSKKFIIGSLVSGVMISGGSISASNSLNFKTLGSGGEIRSTLSNEAINHSDELSLELTCGEKDSKKAQKSETKDAEAKCGDGNCGDDAKKAKTESKSAEANCGGKEDSKADKKKSEKSESKSKEATCA